MISLGYPVAVQQEASAFCGNLKVIDLYRRNMVVCRKTLSKLAIFHNNMILKRKQHVLSIFVLF